ncbi:MAG: DUF1611 domain-containing protein [Thermostichales cyanobacterium BF3_bins_165]
MNQITPQQRLLLLMHQGLKGDNGKTGLSLLRYRGSQVVAVVDADCAGENLTTLTGIPCAAPVVASVAEALAYGPEVLVIGIAPSGGILPPAWRQEIRIGLQAGLCLVNGLHTPMAGDPELAAALHPGAWIWDVRREPPGLQVGTAAAAQLNCRRVLTIGTDMSVGKMSTSLELHHLGLRQGLRSAFVATGQTGIMIAGSGIPLDAVRLDYASGAVEQAVVAAAQQADILHIEGQGSLFHPASTATLPLLRGGQPTHLILVHRPGQTRVRTPQPRWLGAEIPPLQVVIQLYESLAAASPSFTPARVVGIALNTKHLDPEAAQQAIAQTRAQTGLPCTDPIRFGAAPLLAAILAH